MSRKTQLESILKVQEIFLEYTNFMIWFLNNHSNAVAMAKMAVEAKEAKAEAALQRE